MRFRLANARSHLLRLKQKPDECAFLKVAMAKLGWTDIGQLVQGEQEAPPTYYHYGAAHAGMTGQGCTRIDLILINKVALAAFKSYEQLYAQGIAKHSFLSAKIPLACIWSKSFLT